MIEIIFPERFPHSDKCSWEISYEYLSGWPEPTKEESLGNACAILSSKIFNLKLFVSQTKKLSQFLLLTVNISSQEFVSTLNSIVSLQDHP